MTSKELLVSMSAKTGMTQREVGDMLSRLSAVMTDELAEGNTVHVRQFGDFEVRERRERVMVHPQTGVKSLIPQKRQVVFKQSSNLKQEIK
ncbi:MAG: HU family DNA-binding protein [Paludibacteraceae bacterium]|nr:HU family DNA-binding protein [Paludibacteraceae bacterium]